MIWLWIVLGILVLLAVLCLVLADYFFRYAIVREQQKPESDGPNGWEPFAERVEQGQKWIAEHTTREVGITSFDGLSLRGIYIEQPGEAKGTIIAFHGYHSLPMVDYAMQAEFFHSLGYHVLLPYQRSHGKSQGKFTTYGVKESIDCRSWVDWVNRELGEELPVYLSGISMGCATVVMSLRTGLPKNVKGIVADCGFTSPWEIIKHVGKQSFHMPECFLYVLNLMVRARAGFSLKEEDARELVKEHGEIPLLFIHGQEDDFVPWSMSVENFESATGRKELFLVEGAHHAVSYGVNPEEYEKKVKMLLNNEI